MEPLFAGSGAPGFLAAVRGTAPSGAVCAVLSVDPGTVTGVSCLWLGRDGEIVAWAETLLAHSEWQQVSDLLSFSVALRLPQVVVVEGFVVRRVAMERTFLSPVRIGERFVWGLVERGASVSAGGGGADLWTGHKVRGASAVGAGRYLASRGSAVVGPEGSMVRPVQDTGGEHLWSAEEMWWPPFVMFVSSSEMASMPDARLKQLGFYTPGPDHRRDATRHAILAKRKMPKEFLEKLVCSAQGEGQFPWVQKARKSGKGSAQTRTKISFSSSSSVDNGVGLVDKKSGGGTSGPNFSRRPVRKRRRGAQ